MDWMAGFHALIGHDRQTILWWQMSLRGVLILAFGLVLIRLFGRRAFGRQNPLDIVISIVVGSNLSRAITANSRFLPTLAATAALVVLFWLLDHVAARWHAFSRLVKGDPLPLTRNGTPDEHRMRQLGVSLGDIEEAARTSGMRGTDQVAAAVLERSGKISVIRQS